MNCEKCNTELSAGDITFAGRDEWVVMCPTCDHVQSSTVTFIDNMVIVAKEV